MGRAQDRGVREEDNRRLLIAVYVKSRVSMNNSVQVFKTRSNGSSLRRVGSRRSTVLFRSTVK